MRNDRLTVPSLCFQNKLVFLSLWIRVLLFPLHFVLMRAAIWFHCSLKNGESNFLCKTDARNPNFPLSNRWKPLVPDVLHVAISSSVKRTSTKARAAVHISVPFATIVVTLVTEVVFLGPLGRKHGRRAFFMDLTECTQDGTLRLSGFFTGCGCFLVSLDSGAAIKTHHRCDCFGIQCWEVRIIIK